MRFLPASFFVLALAPSAAADLISWGPVQDTTSASEVIATGTLVTAQNCWAQTFASPTVNGVPFQAFAPIGWTNGGWTLNEGSSTGDTEYDALLDSARVTSFGSAGNPSGTGAIRIDTLGTLTVGQSYVIQVWYSDQRVGAGTLLLNDRQMILNSCTGAATVSGGEVQNLASLDVGTASAPLDADPNNVSGAADSVVGQFCVGTFTRTTNEPLYLLVQGVHPQAGTDLRPHVNAFQIREGGPGSLGAIYCTSLANSSGQTGTVTATGSSVAADNDVTLTASQMPPSQFGIFVTSQTQAAMPVSDGVLCLGGSVGRYFAPGQILQSDASGSFSLALDLTQTPQGAGFVAVQSGQTWNFQAWFRDNPAGMTGANFTDGIAIAFQ